MSLRTALDQWVLGRRQPVMRLPRRRRTFTQRHVKLWLEILEDRLAPATLHWTGADAKITLSPGLIAQYYDITPNPDAQAGYQALIYPANASNPTWLGVTKPKVTTVLTGPIDFPNIFAWGTVNPLYIVVGGVYYYPTQTEARWTGYITIPSNGTAGNPISFQTTSDDGSVLYIDGNLVVNNNYSQGATSRQATINLAPGLHAIDVEYWQNGGGASMDARWDPTGGHTYVDIDPATFSYFTTAATSNINWSDGKNWAGGKAPVNGDTVVFDTSSSTFANAYSSNNDISNLRLNGIVVKNAGSLPVTMTGNGVTLTNSDTSLTNGITDTSTPTTSIGLASITLGGNATITNGSAAPTSTTPSLVISSNIDLAGHTLTAGDSTAGTLDAGLTALTGVISSSVASTDSIVHSSTTTGILALSGKNTFDGPVLVNVGLLVDAGNQSLGSLTGVGTTVATGAALGLSSGDNALYTTGVTLNTGSILTSVDGTSPTVAFPLTLAGNALIISDDGAPSGSGFTPIIAANSSLTFGGVVSIGANTLTLDVNNNNGNTFQFNNAITGTTGAVINKLGNQRASFLHDDSGLVATINVKAGTLADGALSALGTGGNAVTVSSGASLGFSGSVNHTEPQTITIGGAGADTGVGAPGALEEEDGASTISPSWTIKTTAGSDLTIGARGGHLTMAAPITLTTNNLQLLGTGGDNPAVIISATITGPAGSSIVKNGATSAAITSNNTSTFKGSILIEGGTLQVSTGALGSGTKPIQVKGGGALGLDGADLGTMPMSLSGAGPSGAGAIENISGSSTIGGTITVSGPTTFGSDAGTLTVSSNIAAGVQLVSFTGAGNTVVNGILSGNAGTAVSAGLLEGQRHGAFVTSGAADPAVGTDVQLTTIMAETNFVSYTTVPFPTIQHEWTSDETWIYEGTINWPSDPLTPGSGTLSFAKNFDDSVLLKIDGVTYINNNSWTTPIGTGGITVAAGPHDFDARFGNGGAGAGPSGQNNGGWDGWTNSIGFIMRVDKGSNDPLANSKNVSDYKIPTDPGDGSLFTVGQPNVLTKTGSGTLTLNGANTYAAPTLVSGGTLVAGSSRALGNTSQLTVKTGAALVLAAAGGFAIPATVPVTIGGSGPTGGGAIESLGGVSTIAGPITLTSAATIAADGGTLTLSGNIGIGNGIITYAGSGNTNVTGQMTTVTPGLLEGQTNTAPPIAVETPDPRFGTDVELTTVIAERSRLVEGILYPFPTSQHECTSNDCWIYSGTIFWPNDPLTPGSGTLSFAKDFGDSVLLKIDGVTYINNNSWTTPIGTGGITLAAGPHDFLAEFESGSGNGANAQNNAGWTGWTNSIGFIYRVDKGTADPLAVSKNVSDYFQATPAYPHQYRPGDPNGGPFTGPAPDLGGYPTDPGNGSLFETSAVTGVVKNGSGTVTLAPVNTILGPTTINGGTLKIAGDASLGGGSNAGAMLTINGGTLEVTGTSTTALNISVNSATSGINVDAGQTLTVGTVLSGTGTLNKSGSGTLVLGAANSYSGETVDASGMIVAKTSLSLGTGLVTLAGGTLSLQASTSVQQSVAATGYNSDVVWDFPVEPLPVEGTTGGFSSTDSPPSIFYTAGTVFSPAGTGLPLSGQISSLAHKGVSFQLQSYTANNDLRLTGSSGASSVGTLTLATPTTYQTLNLLDMSANGTATYNLTLNFADGTSDTIATGAPTGNRNGTSSSGSGFNNLVATPTFSEVARSDAASTAFTSATGAMWEQDFTLPVADQAKVLKSITLQDDTSGPALNFFGVASVKLATTVAFANAVNVTASSTIDVPSQSTAMGPATLSGGTLTVTGTATTLTLGATSITGSTTLAPAAGETIALGTITSGGTTPSTLTVAGAGTVNLSNIPSGITLSGTGTVGTPVAIAGGGTVHPGTTSTATLTTSGGIALASGATDAVDIGAPAAGSYDSITSGGTIDVTGATLSVSLMDGFVPATGQTFIILKNIGSNPITGTFAGLPEGAEFALPSNSADFTITYVGGSGHDVVLTAVIPGPTTHFSVRTSATTAAAGSPLTYTVSALDANNLVAGAYTGTVHFTSSDAQAVVPANSMLTDGVGTFTVAYKTATSATVTTTDTATPSIHGTSAGVSVSPGATNHFAVAGTKSDAKDASLTLTAEDQYDNPTGSGYTGTVHFTSTDPGATLPVGATLTYGTGVFPVTQPSGTGQVTVSDSLNSGINGVFSFGNSGTSVSYFTVSAPVAATTGNSFQVTVTAIGSDRLPFTAYNGRVHLTSSDAGAVLPPDASLTNGVGTFTVTLMTAGSQTVTASDSRSLTTPPLITGTSAGIGTRGLVVTGFTPNASGFSATFSKPFNPADLTLYGPGLSTVQDVTLVGAAKGPIAGSLIVNSTNDGVTFVATENSLTASFGTTILPDDTYTVSLVSGTGTSGFLDALNTGLDGADNGGHADYTNTFVIANGGKPTLSIPDFARGPDGLHKIQIPNNNGQGIPITLANAVKVTDVMFTLSYDPMLLSIMGASGGLNSDATDPGGSFTQLLTPNVYGQSTFLFHDNTPQSGTVVLGDILANVPNSAAGSYRAMEILQVVAITINQGAFSGAVSVSAIHINAYFGDVSGNGTISGLDVAQANMVAQGKASGFAAYPLLDPAIVGDVALDYSVDAGDVSDLAAFTVHLPTPEIPPIPTGLIIPPSPSGAGAGRGASETLVTPPVTRHPPPVTRPLFVTLDSIPNQDAGWQATCVIDPMADQIGADFPGFYSLFLSAKRTRRQH